MTKLLEWLSVFGIFLSIWYSLISGKYEQELIKQYPNVVLYLPVILIALFGVYSVFVVIYRTLTFNNCEEAASELKKDIEDARMDLDKLGFVFSNE